MVGLVPPTVFVPRPKVDSALVRLRPSADAAGGGAVGRRPVHAGAGRLRAAAQDAAPRRCVPCSATRTPAVLAAAGVEPTARAEALGLEQWAAVARERGGAPREARARSAPPRIRSSTSSLRVLGPSRRRLPRPRVAGGLARPAPRRARGVRGARTGRRAGARWSAPRSATTSRPTTATSPFIAAEKLMVRAGSFRSRRAAGAAQAHPRRRRARRRVRRRRRRAARGPSSCSTSTSTTPGCSRSRAEVGSDVPFCVPRRRGVDARARRDHRTGRRCRRGWRSSWRSRRSGCRRPTSTRRGTSSAARAPTRVGARAPPASRTSLPELVNDLEPAAEALEPRLRGVPRRARGRGRRGPRCWPAAGRPTWCRSPTRGACPAMVDQVGRRLRVPVVGDDQRVARRPPRQLSVTRSAVGAADRSMSAPPSPPSGHELGFIGPAAGAASASSSEASCASSSACACGAS